MRLPPPQVTVVAEGLVNPIGLAALPDGGILIAEEGTGENDLSAGISLLTAEGALGRIISGLPSSRDAGDLSGVPFVSISPDGNVLYTGHFNLGHLWTIPLSDIPAVGQPVGPDFLTATMMPLNNVRLTNPFDMTFSRDGRPVVSDASENGVAMENPDGTTRFFHRFDDLANPTDEKLLIDPVPTGITRVGDEYLVTLTGGCPYPPQSGELVAIDEDRNTRKIVVGLDMPIDVAVGPDGDIWLLEFARFEPGSSCFSGEGYLPESGRLSRYNLDSGDLEVVLDGLDFPGAVLPMPDGSLFLSEVFSGRILKITFGDSISSETEVASPATPMDSSAPLSQMNGPIFLQVADQVGLNFQHGAFRTEISMDPVAMMGAGLCWIDYDNDGWLDLYVVNSYANAETEFWELLGGLPRNALYKNDQGQFVDRSAISKSDLSLRGNGCVAADFNADGWMDLYITADGPNALLWNQGDGTFQEGAKLAGLDASEWSTAAAVGDLNGDGWPDLFVGAYIDLEKKIPVPTGSFPQDFYGLPDHVYLNLGATEDQPWATFQDVTLAVGLLREERALGALFSDLDADGDLDLYITNDGNPNRLYANQAWPGGVQSDPEGIGFRFLDLTDISNTGDSGSGMGVAGGDYDGDGMPDLFVTNWQDEVNALYQNRTVNPESLTFLYSTYRIGITGLGSQLTGWGTTWFDYDHDTDLDLVVVNGYVPVSNLKTDGQIVRLYRNRSWNLDGSAGPSAQFFDWTERAGLMEIGPLLARGSAVADYDNDGDLDLAVNTIGGSLALIQNQGTTGNWLQIKLGNFAPGARVEVTLPDGRQLIKEVYAGSSYLASEDDRLHFGLGPFDHVSLIEVRWPDGLQMLLKDVTANQQITLEHPGP